MAQGHPDLGDNPIYSYIAGDPTLFSAAKIADTWPDLFSQNIQQSLRSAGVFDTEQDFWTGLFANKRRGNNTPPK